MDCGKWKTVLWSDESRFEVLFGKVGRHVIWTKEDKDNPSCYQHSVQKPASLMVWGCMSNMELVPCPPKTYGQFFEGDSYVILYTHKTSNNYTYDLHYWLGKDTSQDEQGAAAIYTTQMDEHLGGAAVQHRETQGHESATFQGYFKQGGIKIFIWKGKKASKTERAESLKKAEAYIKAKGYPASTYVETVSEGAESSVFKQLFQKWTDKGQTAGLGSTHSPGKIAKVEQVKFDATSMHARPDLAAQQKMVDDGSGEAEVWRIEDNELAPVERKWLGHFYGGDCYLILYKYEVNSKLHYILYMWQGRHASTAELTASAYQAVILDQKYNGEPVQVRVPMGKEPMHLMAIFKGKMIVYEEGSSREGSSHSQPSVRLFHVHGTNEFNTRATEVPPRSSSLNSNDVFVLSTDKCCYLWYGKGCSGDEREMAKTLADIISKREKHVIAEGQEPADFWVNLGGKSQYASSKRLQEENSSITPRLFECSNQTGRFIATEMTNFNQDDLDEDDVMLLDIWDQVYLWIGKGANDKEKNEAVVTAQEYLKSHPAGRDLDTPILVVKQGFEPPTFTGWFHAWDPQKWSVSR
uniref:Villin 1 n=1 Tax=Cyprinus carpio TaxID=7962 RepID=A0A8C2DUV6_CYPCA